MLSWNNKRKIKKSIYNFLLEDIQNEYVVIDCETTGLDPKKDEIISLAALLIKDDKIVTSRSLHLYIKPSKEIKAESIKVHKIRACDLTDTVDPKEAMERLLYFIKGRAIVGYYIEFDKKLIDRYIKNYFGFFLPNRTIDVSGIYYDYKQKFIPQGYIDLRFDTILKDLRIPRFTQHNAFYDALMSALIFLKLTKK